MLAFSSSLLAQDAVNGLFLGAIFALLGIGVVLIYKSSGVLNFAHGSMAMFCTYIYFQIDRSFHLPVGVSMAIVSRYPNGKKRQSSEDTKASLTRMALQPKHAQSRW